MSAPALQDAVVVLDPGQVELVRRLARLARLNVVGVATPQPGRHTEIAEALGCRGVDDVRHAVATAEAPVVLLASPGEFGADPDISRGLSDLEALRTCRARGVKVASLEPVPASILQLSGNGRAWLGAGGDAGGDSIGAGVELVRPVPLFRLSRSMADAGELIGREGFGAVRSASLVFTSSPGEGSLGARLLDALDTLASLLGEPETVSAAWTDSAYGQSLGTLRRVPAQSLRGLDGDLVVALRYSDGRCASIAASNHGGGWRREVTLLGPGGRVLITDSGLRWADPAGRTVDASGDLAEEASGDVPDQRVASMSPAGVEAGLFAQAGGAGSPGRRVSRPASAVDAPGAVGGPSDGAWAIADALERFVEGREPASKPVDIRGVLAAAGAVLLSARTGEGESPATLSRMAGFPLS